MDNTTAAIEFRLGKISFYEVWFPRLLKLVTALAGLIIALTAALAWLATQPPKREYFATRLDGGVVPMTPLDAPLVSDSEAGTFAVEAITAAYTFSFSNREVSRQAASLRFTPDAWQSHDKAVSETNLFADVQRQFLNATAVASSGVTIPVKGTLPNGAYAWHVQFNMMLRLENGAGAADTPMTVQALVVRSSNLETPKGILVAQAVVRNAPARN